MRRLIGNWLGQKQRRALRTDEALAAIEQRTEFIQTTVRKQRVNEMRIAEMSPSVRGSVRVNPVYDRIKGQQP